MTTADSSSTSVCTRTGRTGPGGLGGQSQQGHVPVSLAGRRGKKRAIVAVGHTMLVMIYHMLKDGVDYQELGHAYLDKLQPQRLTRYLVKRLGATC